MSMQLTPSSKSAFFAGIALSLVAWLSIFHIDELAKLFRLRKLVSQKKFLTWINENKALAFLGTEFLNFGVHGVSGSDDVTFALGSTLFNAIMIFITLPLKFMYSNRKTATKIFIIKPTDRKTGTA